MYYLQPLCIHDQINMGLGFDFCLFNYKGKHLNSCQFIIVFTDKKNCSGKQIIHLLAIPQDIKNLHCAAQSYILVAWKMTKQKETADIIS